MLKRGRRRLWLLAGLLLCLSQLGAACQHPRRPDYQIGFVRLGDRLAVYTPICPGDTVRTIQVHAVPPAEKSGNSVLLWEAADPVETGPAGADTRDGLIVLGAGFGTVRQAPPAQFDRTLSVAVDTADGRSYSDAVALPEQVAQFPADTPLAALSFDTDDGRVNYDTLRAHFEREITCR
ncbi:hypothetical protein AB0B39_17505 [Micromonospora sp. NPDC049114]|uniref:hypothetical protein n=1 Tax=Micromonospora sp. NPDC049114 TaxID=3155498 RepID=UPI0033DFEC94